MKYFTKMSETCAEVGERRQQTKVKINENEDRSYQTRAQVTQEFYHLLEYAVSSVLHLDIIAQKLISVVAILGPSSELVKFTFEFYKNVYPIRTNALLSSLHARGALKELGLVNKSCIGSFMSQLLFRSVTESSVECTKYSTQLWMDRISNENVPDMKTPPNPLQYLNPTTLTHISTIPFSTILQFKLLDEQERKLIILDFRKLAGLIPHKFHPRIAVAFFIFIEFYKRESSSTTPEVCLWAETWFNMIVASLTSAKKFQRAGKNPRYPPLHHILCGMMISTQTLDFVAAVPDVLADVVKSLETLCENCAGFTEKWASILLAELQSKTCMD